MAGPTTAVLESRLDGLEGRLNRSEQERANEYRELRAELSKHQATDLEQFDDARKTVSEVKDAINEIKIMIAESITDSQDLDGLKRDVESLKLTRAGTKPWLDMLIKLIWALLGAGLAWLLSHGGLVTQ